MNPLFVLRNGTPLVESSLAALPEDKLRDVLASVLSHYLHTPPEVAAGNALEVNWQAAQADAWVRDFFVNLAIPGAISGKERPAVWGIAQRLLTDLWREQQPKAESATSHRRAGTRLPETPTQTNDEPLASMEGVTVGSLSGLDGIAPAELERIFASGVNSHDNGCNGTDCPFQDGTPYKWLWERGWHAAQQMKGTLIVNCSVSLDESASAQLRCAGT